MKKISCILLLLAVTFLFSCSNSPAQTQLSTVHIHEFDTPAVLQEANCIGPMILVRQCKYCSYQETTEEGEPIPMAHHFTERQVIQEANCGQPEISVCFCEFCGEPVEEETAPPNGSHDYSPWFPYQEANCGSGEMHMRYCQYCSHEDFMTVGAPTGEHSYHTTVLSHLDCMHDEILEKSCSLCGTTEKTVTQMAQGHNMKNGRCTTCGRGYSEGLDIRGDRLYGIGTCTDTDIVVPEGVKRVEEYAFRDNQNLLTIDLPDSLEMISMSAFENCTNMTRAIYPEHIHVLEGSGSTSQFSRCKSLTSIVIPMPNRGGLSSIADYFCEGCTGLLRVEFASSENTVYTGLAFLSVNSSLRELTVPGNYRFLTQSAFSNCKGLKTARLQEGVEVLAHSCFYGCESLQTVYLPASLTILGPQTFQNCKSLTDIYYAGTEEMWDKLVKNANWDTGCGEYTVHFGGNTHDFGPWRVIQSKTCTLDEIRVRSCPCGCGKTEAKVTALASGHQVSGGRCTVCGKAESTGLQLDRLDDGSGYQVTGLGSCSDQDIIIPAMYQGLPVKRIGTAFADCSHIHSVTLPDTIRVIGSSAFAHCTGLRAIRLPDSVQKIGDMAFDGCTGLRSVTLPAGLTECGYHVFSSCENLLHIEFGSCPVLGDAMFLDCISLVSVVIPGTIRAVPGNAFAACYNLKTVTMEEGVEKVVGNTFGSCFSLESVYCPDSILDIDGAFNRCWSLHILDLGGVIPSTANNNLYNVNTIYFSGTMQQWQELPHGRFDTFMSTYTVYCTDGEILVEKTLGFR